MTERALWGARRVVVAQPVPVDRYEPLAGLSGDGWARAVADRFPDSARVADVNMVVVSAVGGGDGGTRGRGGGGEAETDDNAPFLIRFDVASGTVTVTVAGVSRVDAVALFLARAHDWVRQAAYRAALAARWMAFWSGPVVRPPESHAASLEFVASSRRVPLRSLDARFGDLLDCTTSVWSGLFAYLVDSREFTFVRSGAALLLRLPGPLAGRPSSSTTTPSSASMVCLVVQKGAMRDESPSWDVCVFQPQLRVADVDAVRILADRATRVLAGFLLSKTVPMVDEVLRDVVRASEAARGRQGSNANVWTSGDAFGEADEDAESASRSSPRDLHDEDEVNDDDEGDDEGDDEVEEDDADDGDDEDEDDDVTTNAHGDVPRFHFPAAITTTPTRRTSLLSQALSTSSSR